MASLNIKTAEAHQLAKELAELTGESMATATTEALRERRDRIARGRRGVAEQLLEIGRLAADLGQPLLFKGSDFSETDLPSALA